MKKVLVYSMVSKNHIGGAETLAVRIAEWCFVHGFVRIIYILPYAGVRKPMFIEALKKTVSNLEIYYDDWENLQKLPVRADGEKLFFRKNDYVLWFHDLLDLFIKGEYIRLRNHGNAEFHPYMYVIYPDNVKKEYQRLLLKRLFYKICISRMNQFFLVFMDNDTRIETERFYNIQFRHCISAKIPMVFEMPFSEYLPHVMERYRSGSFTIMTICRMEFPHKGYVLGLIKIFEKLRMKYKNIKLIIIGDCSPARDLVNAEIRGSSVSEDISLLGPVAYDELEAYMLKADVFVGMGTTLLDAARIGTICIPVDGIGYDLNAMGFFYEVPELGSVNRQIGRAHV